MGHRVRPGRGQQQQSKGMRSDFFLPSPPLPSWGAEVAPAIPRQRGWRQTSLLPPPWQSCCGRALQGVRTQEVLCASLLLHVGMP